MKKSRWHHHDAGGSDILKFNAMNNFLSTIYNTVSGLSTCERVAQMQIYIEIVADVLPALLDCTLVDAQLNGGLVRLHVDAEGHGAATGDKVARVGIVGRRCAASHMRVRLWWRG